MTDKSAAAVREFIFQHLSSYDEWGYTFEKPGSVEALTAFIEEHYVAKEIHERLVERAYKLTTQVNEMYPREFIEWIAFESARLYYREVDETWIKTRFVMGENPTEEYDEYTFDELYQYWEENLK